VYRGPCTAHTRSQQRFLARQGSNLNFSDDIVQTFFESRLFEIRNAESTMCRSHMLGSVVNYAVLNRLNSQSRWSMPPGRPACRSVEKEAPKDNRCVAGRSFRETQRVEKEENSAWKK